MQPSSNLVVRQLIPGRDVCLGIASPPINQPVWQFAVDMANCMYIVGDKAKGVCALVDPCWDVKGILKVAESLSVKVVAVILTHYHFDHTGGTPPPPYGALGIKVEGVADVVNALGVPVYVGSQDLQQIISSNVLEVAKQDNQIALSGTTVVLRFIHTPGHTPGGQCILINGTELVTGDTVFANCCGRVDFPDCDPKKMYHSLRRLATLPDSTTIWPGHDYGGAKTSVRSTKEEGVLPTNDPYETWLKAQL